MPTPVRGKNIAEDRPTPVDAPPRGPTPFAAIRRRGRQTGTSPDTRGWVSDRAARARPYMETYSAVLPAADARVVYKRAIGRGSPFFYSPLFADMEMHPAALPATNAHFCPPLPPSDRGVLFLTCKSRTRKFKSHVHLRTSPIAACSNPHSSVARSACRGWCLSEIIRGCIVLSTNGGGDLIVREAQRKSRGEADDDRGGLLFRYAP